MHFIDTLIEKLAAMAATASKNEKLAILKTLQPDELSIVIRALDPTVNYYVAKLPDPVPSDDRRPWGPNTTALLLHLCNREITGTAALREISEELGSLTEAHADLLRKVLLKDLRAGIGETLVNAAHPGAVPVFPYMRCSLPDKSNLSKWGPDVWAAGVISDLKADGMFASLTTDDSGRVSLLSRQGSRFPADALPHLHQPHKPLYGQQLHGELVVLGPTGKLLERQVGNGVLNSLLQGGSLPQGTTVRYQVWDVIPATSAVDKGSCDTPARVRRDFLTEMVEDHPVIELIESKVVHSKDEAMEHYRSILARGLEGTIIKNPFGLWKDGTSKDCVKMKVEFCVDLRVTGVTPGTGKNEALFGSLSCETACGTLAVDVSGLTDDMRRHLHDLNQQGSLVGTVIAVKANGVMAPSANNERYSLFLPRFDVVRLDKREADDLESVLAQLRAATA